jgi:hypothetical protein
MSRARPWNNYLKQPMPCHSVVFCSSLDHRAIVSWSAFEVQTCSAYIRLYLAWYLSTDVLMQEGQNKIVLQVCWEQSYWVWEGNKGNPLNHCQGNVKHCNCSFYNTTRSMLCHACVHDRMICGNFARLFQQYTASVARYLEIMKGLLCRHDHILLHLWKVWKFIFSVVNFMLFIDTATHNDLYIYILNSCQATKRRCVSRFVQYTNKPLMV